MFHDSIFTSSHRGLQNRKLRWILVESALYIHEDAYGIDELIKKGPIIVEK